LFLPPLTGRVPVGASLLQGAWVEDAQGQVSGDAAEVYERFFVPALFAEWAPRVADVAGILPGRSVLDVACGTGVLTREAARRAGEAQVVGLDRNEGMLRVARARAPSIQWRQARAEALPYEDGTFDVAVCQFGLMFFEDRARALREMWRVLRPGGRLAVAVWGPLAETPGYAAMTALLDRLFGEHVADELRAPFALGDPGALASVLDAADIPDTRVIGVVGQARFPSLEDWVQTDIRGWTLSDVLADDDVALLAREAEAHLQPFVEEGAVRFASPALLAWADRG